MAVLPSGERGHVALIKRMGRLQTQESQLVRCYEAQSGHWQAQLMRHSIRLNLDRTRGDWGLVGARRPANLALSQVLDTLHTEAVICRTGCQI